MSNLKTEKSRIVSGAAWKFLERVLAQIVSFVISIVLARLLTPREYGLVTILLIFITIANVFVTNGICDALIQKRNSSNIDFSSMFWVSLMLSIFLYIILFLLAPIISRMYHNAELVWLFRVLALRIPIAAFNNIQHAYVSKKMEFKKFFYSTLLGTLISGIAGIILATRGYGAWALVFQYLINNIIDTIVLLVSLEWRPKLEFSLKSIKELLPFSLSMTFSALINTIYGELQSFIIGFRYSVIDLSLFKKGFSFPQLAITNTDVAISSVLFPVISETSHDIKKITLLQTKFLKIATYCIFPLMAGMAIISKEMIIILLTEKWLGAREFVIFGCVFYAIQPIQSITWQSLKAFGRGDICIKCELVKKMIGLFILSITSFMGIWWIAFGIICTGLISCYINMNSYKKITNTSLLIQLKEIIPNLLLTIVMTFCVLLVRILPIRNELLFLCVQIIVGVIVYCLLSSLTSNTSFITLKNILFSQVSFIRLDRKE